MQRDLSVTSNEIKLKKPRRQVRFPGICTAAEELLVTREHLYFVLTGQRKSKRLTDRYNAWKAKNDKQNEVVS